ncbi:TIGR00251 family protein [Vavraia culicis subsp. floridensis]|uniref:TIGR00251 family protein n=1 Tax=Vavraia culicis (isolate floridensis) TaxID=948595 RepID=L2GWX2_VAVCU|nr:TIGR00251 family protein [Vavraia culicis subsp. floridensis]ELA48176.1 TIGR00251 family protein [Vavraia culicis subsp. floridensis]
MSFAKSTGKGVLLNLVIRPGSNCTGLTRIQDGQLHVDVNAVPEKNKANKEVIRFISTLLKVDKSSVSIVSGLKSRNKIVMVRDETDGERIEKVVLQDLDGR